MNDAPRILIVLLLAGLVTGCASVSGSGEHNPTYDFSSVERTAVVSVEGIGNNETVKAQIAAMTNQALLGKGYSPVERNQIQKVREEQEFSRSDLTSAANAAEFGRVLNVDTIVLVNIPKYDSEMSMSMQMVDAENATIVWSASGSADEGAGALAGGLFGAMIGAASGAAIGNTGEETLGGAAAGGASGALAGEAMKPQRQEQAANLINRLAESLPGPA